MEKLSPPVRIFALVAALAAVGGALFLFTAGGAPAAEPSAVPALSHAQALKAAAARTAGAKKPVVKAEPAGAAASGRKPKVAPKVAPTGYPTAVDEALAKNEIVVVSLVVPGGRVDSLAAGEAQAGARLAGAGYLALNVLNETNARALLRKLGTLEDPTLLVLKGRKGDVALKLTGFVDRETVAQAAANAAS